MRSRNVCKTHLLLHLFDFYSIGFMTEYTAVSFAPVQGFIEKSRKLRDLFGASLILSYLSFRIVEKAKKSLGADCVISPGLINLGQISEQEGMPNRILLRGEFSRNEATNTLLEAWGNVLEECKHWIECEAIPDQQYFWEQEWIRWRQYTWEVFWGHGDQPMKAMRDLERRKLRRNWTGINWIGGSSSLTGTDAIAFPLLGKQDSHPGRLPTSDEKDNLENFYQHLAWILDDPYKRAGKSLPTDEELQQEQQQNRFGKYIAANERLSIPELVKRLVTWPKLARQIKMSELEDGFRDIVREPGYWTGWFMGDGDEVGNKLQKIANKKGDEGLTQFSLEMRDWGRQFKEDETLFPNGKGRVVYSGGDDFLGVFYSEEAEEGQPNPEKLKAIQAFNWLLQLPAKWKDLQAKLQKDLEINYTYSVGFVWAGHKVPQRDILQHCREAEKRAKSLGRDRVTIRVVFNSGQYVQWTCPWNYLDILTKYRDRDGNTYHQWECQSQDPKYLPNWTHIYNDWAQLKARHAIELKDTATTVNEDIALAIFKLYFDDSTGFESQRPKIFKNNTDTPQAIAQWIDGLVNVGWQLCSNT